MNIKIEYRPVSFAQLETDLFVLEPIEAKHAATLYNAFQDKSLYTYIDRSPPKSVETMGETIQEIKQGAPTHLKQEWFTWVGRSKATEQLMGWFEASNTEKGTLLAYTVFPQYQRKGFAVAATQAIIDHFKEEYRTNRFILEMDTRNRVSVKVAERLGFQWKQTINKACTLHGFESHEFEFHLEPDYS